MGRTLLVVVAAACWLLAGCADDGSTFGGDAGADGGVDVGADTAEVDTGRADPARMGFGCDTVADCDYETACVFGVCSPCETSMDCGFQRMCDDGLCVVVECDDDALSDPCDNDAGEWCSWPGLTLPTLEAVESGEAGPAVCTQAAGCDYDWAMNCSAPGDVRPWCNFAPGEPASPDCPDPQSRFWAE